MWQYLLFCIVVLGLGYGALRYWSRRIEREIAEGAATEYKTLQDVDPDLIKGLDADGFAAIYRKTTYPRFPAYALSAIGIFMIGTPLALGIMSAIAYLSVEWGFVPTAKTAATELYLGADETSVVRKVSVDTVAYIAQGWGGFYYFFGLLAFWIGTLFFVMRRYHQRTPGTLREEILRAR